MKIKKGKLAKIIGLAALVSGLFLIALPTLALKLQLQYPLIPGAEKTLNELVEDKMVAGKLVPAQFTIPDIFIFLFQAAIWIGVILAFFSLVYIGFRFATSGGDPIRLKGAKERLRGIAFGILVLIGSFLLLRLINPELTALRFAQQGVCATAACENPTGFDLDEETNNVKSAGGLTVYSENGFAGNAVNILTDIPEAQKQLVGSGGLSSANGSSGVLLRSLKLAPNCRVRLYENTNYEDKKDSNFIEIVNNGTMGKAISAYNDGTGKPIGIDIIEIPLDKSGTLLFSRIDDLEIKDKNYWGDDIDSIQFMADGPDTGWGCKNRRGVVFYDSVKGGEGSGRREAFWNDEENFKTTFVGNDSASFMKMVGNVELTVYDDAKFEGSSRMYTTTTPPTGGGDLTKETWKDKNNKDEIINDKISSLKISFPVSP